MAASNPTKALAFFLSLTLLSSTLVSACGSCGTPPVAKPPPPTPPKPTPCAPPIKPTPPSPSKPPVGSKCPLNTLKLGVCADLLGLVNVVIGSPPSQCCSLIQGLTDLQAALCLCTALKANVLGINLNVPISLSVILNTCDKSAPSGFQCPSST